MPVSDSDGIMSMDLSDGIFKRDSCATAFGVNATNSQCAPSNTLCCVFKNQQFPSCQQYLNKGWCCVGTGPQDGCYVDQPSACGETNAVTCTNNLDSGTSQACCPRLTTCVPGYTFSENFVRCQIIFSDLQRAAATSEAPSSSTTSTSSTSSLATTSTSPTLATTELPGLQSNSPSAIVSKPAATDQAQQTQNSPPPAGLPTAAVAGISIGLTLAIVTAVAFLILWLRSRRRARLASQPTQATPALPEYEQYKANEEHASAQAQRLYWQPASHEPVEIMGSTPQPRAPIEM